MAVSRQTRLEALPILASQLRPAEVLKPTVGTRRPAPATSPTCRLRPCVGSSATSRLAPRAASRRPLDAARCRNGFVVRPRRPVASAQRLACVPAIEPSEARAPSTANALRAGRRSADSSAFTDITVLNYSRCVGGSNATAQLRRG